MIKADFSDLEKCIKDVEAYKKKFDDNVHEVVKQTVKYGEGQAKYEFNLAQYDGENDVKVTSKVFKKSGTVTASGQAVLFIEFGTGIYYPHNHPEASKFGFVPGSYGPNGLKRTWGYYGVPGTHGVVRGSNERGQLVTTHGNPSNKCMYNTGKKMERMAPLLARGIFI